MMQTTSKHSALAFPWPSPHESAGPAIRMLVSDPVWLAVVRQTMNRWRRMQPAAIPLITYGDTEEIPAMVSPTLLIVEVGSSDCQALAEWLNRRPEPVIALLTRGEFAEPAARQAATSLLFEVGVGMVAANPLEFVNRGIGLLEEWKQDFEVAFRDPLDELPGRCWCPAWQQTP